MLAATAPDAIAYVALFAGAAAQAVSGIGFALVGAPFVTVALGGADGVRVVIVLGLGVNLLTLWRDGASANLRYVGALLLPAVVAGPLAAWALAGADSDTLSVVCGLIVLASIAALAGGFESARLSGRAGAVIAGAVSGAMNTLGGVGGPAAAGYALNARWPSERQRATLATYFLGLNLVSVASRGMPPVSGRFWVVAAAAVVGGFLTGVVAAGHFEDRGLRAATLLLAALGACIAVASGLA